VSEDTFQKIREEAARFLNTTRDWKPLGAAIAAHEKDETGSASSTTTTTRRSRAKAKPSE
jgi:hypothetical protein